MGTSNRHTPRTVAIVGIALGAAVAVGPTAASADTADTPSFPWPTVAELEIEDPSELVGRVIAFDPRTVDRSLGMRVVPVQTVEQDAAETVVTLSSDILFDPSDATLSPAAETKVGELVADVPDGATVQVHGHTDTVDTDAANQDLSERRAEAVADAIRGSRDDLTLDVRGFGESQLAEPETGDAEAVAEARAANRRVELRYEH